jgi:hypothetical protein
VGSRTPPEAQWRQPRRARTALRVGARAAAMPPTAAAAQTGTDVPAARSTEITALQVMWLSLPGQVPWSPRDPGRCQGRQFRCWVAYPH